MSVIIRLQNLPWNASALDIRRFFHGLSIPDGGVHIIGGEKGDAFIAFSTDEDARQGMMLTGEHVNDVPVKLFLSSKTEMQNVIASARTGPVNVVKPKEDDFRGPGYPESRGAGFSDMAGPRIPGSVLSSPPQSMMFGGNNSFKRDAGFSQSGGLNNQRGTNQGDVNRNLMGSNRPGLNSMGASSQTGVNKPFGKVLFDSNLRDEGNQLGGFNRSGGRMANNEVKQIIPGRMQGPPGQGNQIRSLFDAPLNAGSRNGNGRSIDKPMGGMLDMPNNRASQLGGARMSEGFGGNDNMVGLNRNLDLSFNRPDNASRDVPRNFDPVNRFSRGNDEFERSDQFNNKMDVDIDRSRFNDFGTSNESGFNRPSDQNFSGVVERSNLMEPSRGNIGRFGERDVNNDRRDPFGFGRDQVDMRNRDEFGRNEGMGGVDFMMGPRRETGIASDFDRVEGFEDPDDLRNLRDDIGSNEQFRNERFFEKQGPVRQFGGQETGRLFDEWDQGRDFGMRDPGTPFGGQVPIPSLMGQNSKNSLSSLKPMDDSNGGRPARLERGKIEGLMSPRDHLDRCGIGGYHSPHLDLCIRIFNLPITFNYREVRNLFRGCEIPREGLKLVNDQFGERSGEAFIRFESERAFSFALALNNRMVEGKKVRVESCTMREYNDAVDSYQPPRKAPIKTNPARSRSPINRKTMDPCILITKMPLKTTVAEIKKFIGNSLLIKSAGGPFLELNKDNRPTGNAVVEFARERDFKEALMLNRRSLGGSLVSVIGIDKKEFNEKSQIARREAETKNNNTGKDSEKERKDSVSKADSGIKPSHEETCVQLAGLSWETTNESIFEFFKGLKIVKDGIYIVRNRDGKPTGAGYVEFASAADRRRAFLKNKQYMGKRYVEVILISSKQMVERIKAAKGRWGGENAEVIVLSEDEGNGKSKIEHTVRMQNLHSDCQLEDIMDFFHGLRPIVDSIKLQYKDGKPTGDGLISFQTSRESAKAISDFNRRSMLGRAVTLSVWPKK